MSKQVDAIFKQHAGVFAGREADIKSFLTKNAKKIFKDNEVFNIERIDASDKLENAGYREKISSWRNSNGDTIISSCLTEVGVQKRYDYIFYMGKREDLEQIAESEVKHELKPEKAIPIKEEHHPSVKEELKTVYVDNIQSIYRDSFKLRHSFQFEQAILQIDSMIDLLLERKLPEYTKKLEEKKQYLIAAQEIYKKRSGELSEIEKKVNTLMQEQESTIIKDRSQFENNLTNINALIEELKAKDFPEYSQKLENKKKEIVEAQEIYEKMKMELKEQNKSFKTTYVEDNQIQTLKNLERSIKLNKEFGQFEAARVNIEKMIELLKELKRDDLIQKYSQDLEEIMEEFEYIEE